MVTIKAYNRSVSHALLTLRHAQHVRGSGKEGNVRVFVPWYCWKKQVQCYFGRCPKKKRLSGRLLLHESLRSPCDTVRFVSLCISFYWVGPVFRVAVISTGRNFSTASWSYFASLWEELCIQNNKISLQQAQNPKSGVPRTWHVLQPLYQLASLYDIRDDSFPCLALELSSGTPASEGISAIWRDTTIFLWWEN